MNLFADIGKAVNRAIGAIGDAVIMTVDALADTVKSITGVLVNLFDRLFRRLH